MTSTVSLSKRTSVFAICIAVRLGLAFGVRSLPQKFLPLAGAVALIPAIGFIYQYVTHAKSGSIFGEPPWWHEFRPLHAGMYGLFALLALFSYSNAWFVLLADAVLGVVIYWMTWK